MIAFAIMLFSAAAAAWIVSGEMARSARAYARFACILYAALAVACAIDGRLAASVAFIVCATAPALLAFAARPVPPIFATIFLALASIAGMAAALTGMTLLAFAPLLISAGAIAIVKRTSPQACAASIALVAGASSFAAGGVRAIPALIAFSSAALLGLALALRSDGFVEEQGRPGSRGPADISRPQ